MAAAVLAPFSAIHQNGGILPASALAQHAPRHGRSRGMSVKNKNVRGRGYSAVENSEVTVAKAVSFLLKRAVKEDEIESDGEETEYLISDAEGWVAVPKLLQHPNMRELGADLESLQEAAASSKARFTLRQDSKGDESEASSYQVRQHGKRTSVQAPVLEGTLLTLESENLPEYVLYDTTYQAYPLILAFGSIKRADGATYSLFTPDSTTSRSSEADVSIWIHLRTVMQQAPEISWQLTTTGNLVTSEEVPKSLWKRVIGRRADVGTLFEDGQVRSEVPEFLRGKGGKGKGKKGKAMLKMGSRGTSDSDSEE